MFKVTILIETEQGKDDLLEVLNTAEEDGEISEPFGVQVDEVMGEQA
jgi:hypothetical protein